MDYAEKSQTVTLKSTLNNVIARLAETFVDNTYDLTKIFKYISPAPRQAFRSV